MHSKNEFTINARLPSLNDYINACRSHWSNGARLKAETEELIFWAIKAAQGRGECRRATKPATVVFHWHERNRRRDLDNIFSAKKYILDAMQKVGIIENDDQKHVVGLFDFFHLSGGIDYVTVTIVEVDEECTTAKANL